MVCSLVGFLPGVSGGGGGRILAFVLLRVTQELTEGHHAGAWSLVIILKLTAGHLGVGSLPQASLASTHPLQLVLLEEEEVGGLVMFPQVAALQDGRVVRSSLGQNVELGLGLGLQQVSLACKLLIFIKHFTFLFIIIISTITIIIISFYITR